MGRKGFCPLAAVAGLLAAIALWFIHPPQKARLGMSSPGKHPDVVNASIPVAFTLTIDASCKKLKF